MAVDEDILAFIAKSGRSDRDVSIAATGHDTAVRDLRKNKSATLKTLVALCRELGLELSVGPPRHDGSCLYDGAIDYSGAPVMTAQPAPPLPPLLRARLHLPDAATEADALAALDRLPVSAHQLLARLKPLDDALKALDACRALVEQARSGDPPAAAKGPAP